MHFTLNSFVRDRRFAAAAALLLFTLVAIGAPAQDDPTEKGETYKGREIAQTMHYLGAPWLTRESREREEDCKTLLAALKVKPGDTVCDMGCGNGFYTLKLAKLVGKDGRVIAVDIQPEMLELLKTAAKTEKLTNIEPVLGT